QRAICPFFGLRGARGAPRSRCLDTDGANVQNVRGLIANIAADVELLRTEFALLCQAVLRKGFEYRIKDTLLQRQGGMRHCFAVVNNILPMCCHVDC
ncbi:MAG: hypothetical protein ACKPKO_36010, partial [Candidatus Fonsibacter sp.]